MERTIARIASSPAWSMIQQTRLSPPVAESLRLEVIESEERLSELAADFDRLSQGIPFRGWDWQHAWWRHFRGAHDRLCVLAARDARGVQGIAPLFRSWHWAKGRVITLLGSGEVCSDHLTLLCAAGREAQFAQMVAQWLTDDAAGTWDRLELEGVDGDDRPIELLAGRLEAMGQAVQRQELPAAWRIALPSDWEDLLARVSKNHRKRVRRLLRAVVDTPRAKLRTVDSAGNLPQGFDILRRLHQMRHESLGQRGCFASPRYDAFHREVCQRLLAAGRLRLEWLEVDGQPAAVTYDLLGDNTVYSYQTGVATSRLEDSPGAAQLAATLRCAVADGYAYYDLLRGNEPYKTSWQAEPRRLEKVIVTAPHLRGRVRRAVLDAARAAKRTWVAGAIRAAEAPD